MGNNWKRLAARCARRAHTEQFATRSDAYALRRDVVCVFNNHPSSTHATLPDRRLEEFVRRLDALGIPKLAYAEYPTIGPDEGYSFALLLGAPAECVDEILALYDDVFIRWHPSEPSPA